MPASIFNSQINQYRSTYAFQYRKAPSQRSEVTWRPVINSHTSTFALEANLYGLFSLTLELITKMSESATKISLKNGLRSRTVSIESFGLPVICHILDRFRAIPLGFHLVVFFSVYSSSRLVSLTAKARKSTEGKQP